MHLLWLYTTGLLLITSHFFFVYSRNFVHHVLNLLRSGYDYQSDPILKSIRKKSLQVTNQLWKNIRSKASKSLSEDFRKLYDIQDKAEPRFQWYGDSWFFGLQHKMPVYRQKIREIVRSWKEGLPWQKNKASGSQQVDNN